MPTTILLAEDEAAIAETVLYALRAEGFAAEHVLLGGQVRLRGRFEIDSEAHRIRYAGHWLELTRYEHALLAELLRRPGAILARAQLLDRVWADALESGERTVDTHVKTLRAKLRALDPARDPIRTHRGLGYSIEVD